ncbi:cGMP-inhibited 3',5'-cyclic phosphodiesterase 3A-like isoform X1 [Clytia hemisphaerica]|uniref:cGMP-inhibited 3',5'-cyclic phosphodiesterase 3A-like isoform X1 n=1 Tax=Clytia hemisphaerica TaxID=252671 RepID=UPI0034D69F3E
MSTSSKHYRSAYIDNVNSHCTCRVDKKTQTYPLKKHSWSHRLLSSFRRRRSASSLHHEVESFVEKKISMSSMDLTILGEAHGMITDLLADTSLPLNVTGTLRIVADMISPLLQHSLHRQGAPLLTVLEKTKNNEDHEQVQNQPDLKDDTPLSLKQRLQRNLGVSSRRMSSSYTTTTSATGMPTIDMEYHHKKSNANKTSANSTSSPTAIKKTSSRSKSYAGALTPAERSNLLKSHSRSFSQSTSPTQSGLLRKELATSDDTIFKVEIERGKPVFFEGMDASESENETIESADEDTVKDIISLSGCTSSNNNNNNINNRTKFVLDERLEDVKETPEKEPVDTQPHKTPLETVENVEDTINETASVEPPSTLSTVEDNVEDVTSESVTTEATETTPPKRSLRKVSDTSRTLRSNSTGSVKNELKSSDSSDNLVIPASNLMRRKSSRELHMEYEIAISRDIDDMLSKVKEWDFPIFELSEKCNVLTQLAFRIFQLCDFFKTFKIAEVTFLKFFRALESGYHNIPYHNRIHAADVLHGVYYLTQHRIPGFQSDLSRRPSLTNTEQKVTPSSSPKENEIVTKKEEKFGYGCICDSVPDLELMALYVAAAMHDFDHPGRTNAFLVATLNSKALLYNDRSVLESHHAAASWSLLVTNPGLNFLSTLDSADFKRFRFIVIEEILSTDLKKHFDFLTEWNAKISDQGGGLNFSSEADRLLLGQMAIKIADISGPSKEWDLHYRWTERIIEEFYQQGEDEMTLGMPTSAYMDRSSPQVPQLQASFIKHLVQPLYIAYEKAGILPGEWVEIEDGDEEEDDDSESDASGEEGDQPPKESDKTKFTMNGPTSTQAVEAEEDSTKDESTEEIDSSTEDADGDKKAIFCVMSDNIKRNYEKWLRIIEEEKEENGENGEEEPENDDT